MDQEILVVVLRRIETFQRLDAGDDGRAEDVLPGQLLDVGLGDALLGRGGEEDLRAVAGTRVGTLAVELGGVVGDGEVEPQQLPVGDALRVEGDLHRLGVAGRLGSHHLVVRGRLAAARVAGDDLGHPLDVLEHALHAPEADPGEHRGLGTGRLGGGRVDRRRGNHLVDGVGTQLAGRQGHQGQGRENQGGKSGLQAGLHGGLLWKARIEAPAPRRAGARPPLSYEPASGADAPAPAPARP